MTRPLPPRPAMRPIPDTDTWMPAHVQHVADLALKAWCDVAGPHWHEAAAVMICSSGRIRDALAALDLVETMRTEHRPVPRRPGSQDLVCARCGTGWRCDYADRLGVPA